jgi:DNA-binding XRE family transcriptional regulator
MKRDIEAELFEELKRLASNLNPIEYPLLSAVANNIAQKNISLKVDPYAILEIATEAQRNNVGNMIKLIRTSQGMTSTELAGKAGISRTQLSRYENLRSEPTVEPIKRIANTLNVPISLLFGEGKVQSSNVS